MYGQILPVLGDILFLFVGNNIKAEVIELRVNNVIQFLYS